MSMRHWWRIYYFENQSDKFDIGKNSENSSKKKIFRNIFRRIELKILDKKFPFHIPYFQKKKKNFFLVFFFYHYNPKIKMSHNWYVNMMEICS